MTKYFSEPEAQALIGKRIRSKVNFCEVPKGSLGTVIGLWSFIRGEWGINIRWDGPDGIIDGFSKVDYKLLEEI